MQKLNVLIVDDNLAFLKAASELIAELPRVSRVDCANSGAEALARIDRLVPDLVMTDLVMPEMSGFELIRRLRAMDSPPRVMAVSLHDGAEYRAAVLRSGAEGLVSKREFSATAPDVIAAMAGMGG